MKKKTGGMVLSLLLAGTMALNTLMLGNVRTAAYEDTPTVPANVSDTGSDTSENDMPQNTPNMPDTSNNNETGNHDPVNGENNSGEKENDPHVQTVKERRIVKIDDSEWKKKIAKTKTYDGKSHIGTQKYNRDDDYSIIFNFDTNKDGLYIYYKDSNGERVKPDISKIKIQGYYADDKGNPSADVAIDAEGNPTEKNVVITHIFFRKGKDEWKPIETFFEDLSDDTVIYDAEQLKDYCYSGSGFNAEAPYAAQGKIEPRKVSAVLNKDVVTHYYGQPFPTITSDKSNTYSYTLDADIADQLEGTFELYGQENKVANRWKDTAPAGNKVNYTLSVVNIKQSPVEYQVKTWFPTEQPDIKYEVEKQADNTYQCFAILQFDDKKPYLLSADNTVEGLWTKKVKLPVDSKKAEVRYYIRNTDQSDTAYLAISPIETIEVVPTITANSKLYTQDDAGTKLFKIFLWQNEAYYTNQKVYIETTLTTNLPIGAELQYVYLSDSSDSTGEIRSVPIDTSDWQPNDKGMYQQTKTILLTTPDNAADTYVVLTVHTPHSEHAKTIRIFARTKDDNLYTENKQPAPVQLVIDTQTPQVAFSVSGNSTKYTAEVTDNTQILRVQYAWDNLSYNKASKTWKNTPENAVRVYKNAKNNYDIDSGKYIFDLTKEAGNILKNAPAAGGKHTLHIQVEDVAGNIHTASYTPDQGYDDVPPQLTKQCLVVADRKSKGGYRILTWNDLYAVDKTVFGNTSFKLLIQAEDATGDTFGTSGVKSVSFNGTNVTEKNMTYQGEQWYAFDLTKEHRYNLKVTLTDNAGNTQTVKLHETFNKLCVESDAPTITEMHLINAEGYIVDDEIHFYNGENGYYNEALRLIVKAEDSGTVASGVRSVTLYTSEKPDDSITAFAPQKIKHFTDKEDLIGKEEEWYTFDLTCGGAYTLKVTAMDNSGNLSEEQSYRDHFEKLLLENDPPVIRKAVLLKAVDEEHLAVLSDEDFTQEGLHGFAHQDIRVMIVPDDKTESVYAGVSGVTYAGKKLEKMTLVYSRPKESTPAADTEKTEDKPAEGGTEEVEETGYIADLTVGRLYNLQFTITDKASNSNTVSLAELIGLSDMLLENDIPSVSVIKPQESIVHDDTTYCGILTQQDSIRVIVRTDKDVKLKEDTEHPSDKTVRSGIVSYKVKDIWYHDTDHPTETTLTEKTFEEGETVYAEPLDFPMTNWTNQEGKHQFVIQVKDKSLNTFTYHSKKFFVDFTAPTEGLILTDNPEKGVVIDGIQWFDGGYVVDLTASFQEKNIDSITVNVEGTQKTEWQYVPNDKDYPVTVDEASANTIHFSLDNQQIPVNDKNTYKITVTATDLAGNQQVKEMTLRRDFDAPQITKVVVQEIKDTPVVKILRRTFGIFYNDGIQLIVHANDRKSSSYDSGMKEVTLSYEGLKEPLSLTYNPERKVYYTELLPLTNGQCFEKHLQLTAYDQFGKSSLADSEGYPNISGTNNQTNLLLIERILPSIRINMPKQDNKAGHTEQKWYSNHSDHVITLTARDVNAGIRSMKVTINGKKITKDSDGKAFLTDAATAAQPNRINAAQTYRLLTEYLAKQVGTQPKDGKYTLLVEVTDNAGNTAQQQTIFYRDVTAPKVESFTLIPNPQDRDNVINFGNAADLVQITDYGFYFRAKFNVVVSVSDQKPSAGLNRIRYTLVSVNGQQLSDETNITNGKAAFEVDKDFKGQIYVSAFDYTQNESPTVTPEAFVIDTEQRHLSEPHITTTALPQTSYTDTDKNPLYTNTVTFSVQITDTVSGIKEFTYQTIAELNSVSAKTITINPKKTYLKGQNLGDGWFVQTVDRNLVTGVSKTYTFEKDDNNISVVWHMKDNANNNSTLSYSPFTVDKTAPKITVTFDGTQQYYNNNRPAKITIVERNFDEKRIQTSIKNSLNGNIPAIHFTSVNNSKDHYEANFDFKEGDYTFAMQGTDRGNNEASVKYTNANSQTFYVDATDPQFVGLENFGSTPLVNSDQTVTLTVTEHNFDDKAMTVTVNKDNTPTTHNDWTTTGDTHTMTITLSADGVYTVSIGGEDKAGRKLSTVTSPKLEIDKTAPKITLEMDGSGNCYTENRTGKITVLERNFDARKIKLQCKKNDQTTDITGLTYQGTGDTHTASFTLKEGDYAFIMSGSTPSVSGVDNAGNIAEVTYTGQALDKFSVDATDPVFGGFDTKYTTGSKLFNEDQTLVLTVEEHNFSAETITVTVHKDGAEIVPPNWKNSGDIHTMDMTLSDDGVYTVSISGTDKAGREIVGAKIGEKPAPLSCTFEIDKTKPETDTDDATVVLTSDNAEEKAGVITFEDKNLKKVHVEVTCEVYEMDKSINSKDEALIRYDHTIPPEDIEASGTIVSINPYDYFVRIGDNEEISTNENASPLEGIYTFTLTAEDRTSNQSAVLTKTYVIMNRGFLACIENSNKKEGTGYYAYAGKEIISKGSVNDTVIVVYAQNDTDFQVKLEDTTSNNDTVIYDSSEETRTTAYTQEQECTLVSPSITRYQLTVLNSIANVIAPVENKSDKLEGNLNVSLMGENPPSQTLIAFKIDNKLPEGTPDEQQDYYGTSEAQFHINNISNDVDIDNTTITDTFNGETIMLKNGNGFSYDSTTGVITVTLKGQGNHNLLLELKDKAGNVSTLEKNEIYIGSFMGRWWPLFLIGGLIIAGFITALIIILTKRNKS